ncbi:hypothetical protein L7F22_043468 [Adiantum nelumboides]|nr:hypothetical protein [Adiantum nelumboides]
MSGPSPPPPPPPPPVEWHPSSGFQSDYDSVPPPPGVFSAPVTFGFPRSPAPALADQIPALWSPGIGAGLFRQVTPSQATFLNPNSSSHCWPTTPSIQSPGVMPGIYLQQTFVSQAPPKLAGYGSQSFCYGTPSTSVAHNANAVSQPTNFDKIDLKEIIPTLRGLIAQVNESVRKIVSMVKIKPDTLPLKTFDPQIVVSTRERMATHSIMEDCLDHRASSESLKRSDELTTASTIFNNILTSSRKSRDNPFYKDAPGVVQVPVYPNDGSFENLKLPDFAMGERWDELTLESFGADREVQGTLLPSRYWLVSKEIAEWTVLPKKLTLYQLKALAGLPLVQQADLKKWLLTHGRSYGVPCSSSLADHIVFLLVFCLRAVHREATPLIDSSEKLALVDCRTLHQTASWLSIQLAPAYDAACCANLVLGLYKYALKMAAYCSVRPLRRSGPEGVQKEESIKVGAGLEQEPHYHPFPSSEACTDLSEQSSCVGDGVLCLQHLAAAILAIHAQAVHKTCTASDLLTCLPNQRSAVHMMVTNKAAEVRATRAGYRAVLEHDGLMWQRPQNQRYCEEHGIKRELTAPYNPSSNGVAERYNRTLCERVRCMLSTANLPHGFWGEALKTAVHVCNRSPNSTLKNDIPEEVWSGKLASYDHLRVFVCEAFVHVRNDLRTKLDVKSMQGLFLGYGEEGEMGYRIWLPQYKKVVRSRDVVFNEAKLLKNATSSEIDKKSVKFQPLLPPIDVEKEPHDALPQAEIDNQPVNLEPEEVGHDLDAPNEDGQPPVMAENEFQQHEHAENELPPDVEPVPENVDHWVRRSTRVRRMIHRYEPSFHYVMLTDEGEPLTYKEAKSCELTNKWELAMQEEIKSLHANNTWDETGLLTSLKGGRLYFNTNLAFTHFMSSTLPVLQ